MEVERVIPDSASTLGNKVFRMMNLMGWKPGDTLGINNRGLRVPIVEKKTR